MHPYNSLHPSENGAIVIAIFQAKNSGPGSGLPETIPVSGGPG